MFQILCNNNNFEIKVFTPELQLMWNAQLNSISKHSLYCNLPRAIHKRLARIPSKRYSKKLKKMALWTELIPWELLNQYFIQSIKQYVIQLTSMIYIPWALMTRIT